MNSLDFSRWSPLLAVLVGAAIVGLTPLYVDAEPLVNAFASEVARGDRQELQDQEGMTLPGEKGHTACGPAGFQCYSASRTVRKTPISEVGPIDPDGFGALSLAAMILLWPPLDWPPPQGLGAGHDPTPGAASGGTPGSGNNSGHGGTQPPITTLPEPATFISGMLGSGLLALFGWCRRRVHSLAR